MNTVKDPHDPKGLIREAYRIDGITLGECRSIFLDWALSVPGDDLHADLAALLAVYGSDESHPMTTVLNEGLANTDRPRRRGGWRSRPRD